MLVNQLKYISAKDYYILNQTGSKALLSGEEWFRYFQETYGTENVAWKATSFEHIVKNPEVLFGSTQTEIAQLLGDGWTAGTYGTNGLGWSFSKGDLQVYYHPGGGIHGGQYYGFKSGLTGKVKLIWDLNYIPTFDDKAIIVYLGGVSD